MLLVLAAGGQVQATSIYTCVDAQGKRLTADRPIRECSNRDQHKLNPDGSVRKVITPSPTADERAEKEAAERRAAAERAARLDAVRRDRNLLMRYPDGAAHRRAREAALAPTEQALQASEQRLAGLARERKALNEEAEFYRGRALPLRLQQALAANDTAVETQRLMMQNQYAEMARISGLFDDELQRLRRLWAGAQPGTVSPAPFVREPHEATGRTAARP